MTCFHDNGKGASIVSFWSSQTPFFSSSSRCSACAGDSQLPLRHTAVSPNRPTRGQAEAVRIRVRMQAMHLCGVRAQRGSRVSRLPTRRVLVRTTANTKRTGRRVRVLCSWQPWRWRSLWKDTLSCADRRRHYRVLSLDGVGWQRQQQQQ